MNTSKLPRVNVLGVGVHAIDMDVALAACESAIEQDISCTQYVCVTGVHGIMEAQRDANLRAVLNNSFLTTPDGTPTLWVGRLQGFSSMQRVFGPELMGHLCRRSVERGYTHFLYGGRPGVAQELKARLEVLFPGIRIVGTWTPPFRALNAEEESDLVHIFDSLRPDITWVGLSTPKQERFMSEYHTRLSTKLMIGVGAAFDYYTGSIKDAPSWVKRSGLQWVHRLAQDPRRLWKRYAVIVPGFLYRIAGQMMGITQYPLHPVQLETTTPENLSTQQ